jgi:putative oxidoreductase
MGALSTHFGNGFFMNWFGTLPAGKEGFEYHLIALALAGTVVLQGSGAWSLDQLLLSKRLRLGLPSDAVLAR